MNLLEINLKECSYSVDLQEDDQEHCASNRQSEIEGEDSRVEHSISVGASTQYGWELCVSVTQSTWQKQLRGRSLIAGTFLNFYCKLGHGSYNCAQGKYQSNSDTGYVNVLHSARDLIWARVKWKDNFPEEQRCV